MSEDNEFLAGEPFKSDRTPGMQLIGGDADFRAKPVFEPVSKAGGGIDQDGGGVHFPQEALAARIAVRHDGGSRVR